MKKAKEPGDFIGKAADILSILKNFTGKKEKPPEEEKKDTSQETNLKSQANTQSNIHPQGVPSLPPHDYGTGLFKNVIEKHDKAIKRIMKNQKKDGN